MYTFLVPTLWLQHCIIKKNTTTVGIIYQAIDCISLYFIYLMNVGNVNSVQIMT